MKTSAKHLGLVVGP